MKRHIIKTIGKSTKQNTQLLLDMNYTSRNLMYITTPMKSKLVIPPPEDEFEKINDYEKMSLKRTNDIFEQQRIMGLRKW